MDNRNTQPNQLEEPRTIVAEDVEINGSIKCTGAVRMGGKLIGDLMCASDVMVEKTATVKGNISVNSIVVQGQVKGNVSARDRIELRATSRVVGDIKAKRLVVEDGAGLVGKSEISPSEAPQNEMRLTAEAEAEEKEPASLSDELPKLEEEEAKVGPAHRAVPRDEGRARASQLFSRK